jgi:hypothetical protein
MSKSAGKRTRMTRPGGSTLRSVYRPRWPKTSQGGRQSVCCGSTKEGNARCATGGCSWRSAGTCTTLFGGCMGAAMRCTTGGCYTPTVIARSTIRGCRRSRPRLARGVREGPSRMRGNSPVRFRGGGRPAMASCYPTVPRTAHRRLAVASHKENLRYPFFGAPFSVLLHEAVGGVVGM